MLSGTLKSDGVSGSRLHLLSHSGAADFQQWAVAQFGPALGAQIPAACGNFDIILDHFKL